MRSDVIEHQLEDAGNEKCDHCGLGFKPDERMNFEGQTTTKILAAAWEHMSEMRDSYMAAECCLSKLMELGKAAA